MPVDTISYTINQAVEASGISRSKIYELIKAKELNPVKIGRSTLLRRLDIEDLLDRNTTH
jgi:excisionase family DNA binding protein